MVRLLVGSKKFRGRAATGLVASAIRAGGQLLSLHSEQQAADRFLLSVAHAFPSAKIATWRGGRGGIADRDTFSGFASGSIDVAAGIGPAVFLPAHRLVAIAVEGEEDQNHSRGWGRVRFNCRDVAIRRAQLEAVDCLLMAPSPSVEMCHRYGFGAIFLEEDGDELGVSHLTVLPINLSALPSSQRLLSPQLLAILGRTIGDGGRAILSHRHGGISRSHCSRCSEVLLCPQCHCPLSYVGKIEGHSCLRCGVEMAASSRCATCGGPLRRVGSGLGKVELLLRRYFPEMAIIHGASWCGEKLSGGCILLSSDPSPPLVEDFKPSLFAVLDGDDLFFPRNFRSEERAFQFLWRMADAMEPGCAFLIQTTNVGCSPLRHFVDGDRKSFCEKEVVSRAPLAYPPHRHLIVQKFLAVGDEFFADFTDRWGALLTSICSSVANSEWKGPIFRKGGGRPAKRSATFWIFTADPEKFFVSLEKGRASNFAPGNGIEERISVDPF